MRVLNNASSLFFNRGYLLSGVSVFNDVDPATGAPSMPATGSPEAGSTQSSTPGTINSVERLKTEVEKAQRNISTLDSMSAAADADQQQRILEAKLGEFIKSIEGMNASSGALIREYRKNGVPNMDAGAQADNTGTDQSTSVGGADMGLGGMPSGSDPMAAESMAPSTTQSSAFPPPMPTGDGSGMSELPAAGASTSDMTTYDDLAQQQGVTGRGGSTALQV